jgi:peptidase M15-like protein
MSDKKFAFGGGAKSRRHWSRCISTLPGNKPILWSGAAVLFSVASVGFIAVTSKVTSSRPVAAAQPSVFAHVFEEFATPEPVAPTLSVRPVAPTIIARPPALAPAQQAGADAATTGTANTDAPGSRQQRVAKVDAGDPWPKTVGARTSTANASAPIDCLPDALRTVLAELQARFGSVTIVSTTHLHTDNHSPGSARANMHSACRAVDVKTSHEPKEVLAFLRARPEVGGINSYRNNVIHFDLNAGYRTASRAGQ